MNTNKGIAEALNIGLDYAKTKKYKYIARLDAGGICLGLALRTRCPRRTSLSLVDFVVNLLSRCRVGECERVELRADHCETQPERPPADQMLQVVLLPNFRLVGELAELLPELSF